MTIGTRIFPFHPSFILQSCDSVFFLVAMMIEIMAGKSASVHGLVHDATPFRFSEENTGIGYHGKLLEEGGLDVLLLWQLLILTQTFDSRV